MNFLGGQTSNELRQVKLKILEDSTCKSHWSTYYDNNKVCAGGVIGQDACQGDSGGPLQCPNSNGQFVLTGIVSFGQVCGTKTPGVYTRVDKYIDWIHSVMKST